MQDLIPTDPETAKEMAKLANQYLGEIAKSPLQEFGGLITDKVKYWRASLQLKQLEKLTKKIKKAGFVPNKLEMKVLFPCLEGISLEEDEKMQNTWTDLMLNYVDPSVNLKLTVYPEILMQLSTPEIRILQHQYLLSVNNSHYKLPIEIKDNFILGDSSNTSITKEICANMERLGLVKEQFKDTRQFSINNDGHLILSYDDRGTLIGEGTYIITNFGIEFVKACTRP